MKMKFITDFSLDKNFVLMLISSLWFHSCKGGSWYKNVTKIYDDKLGPNSGYNRVVRPQHDQTKPINVNVTFDIIAIVEMDAIKQKFIVNGFLGLFWKDELVSWKYGEYENTYNIHPDPNQIWRPRLILSNTLEDRDLFEDDYSPTNVMFNGEASWYPGSLFPTTCKLNLYKYPFDTQRCYIEMFSMGLSRFELTFQATKGVVGTKSYVESGEWEMESTSVEAGTVDYYLPYFKIHFVLRRLPGFFIINIVTPIVLMSFLNILVFLIPVDSGEKISYGITVLLALTVFMSIVSEQVPRSSDTIPLVTVYLLVLMILSVCTVIMSIIIVFFHHREELAEKRHKASTSFKGLFSKVKVLNQASSKFIQVNPSESNKSSQAINDPSNKTKDVMSVMNRMKELRNRAVPPGEFCRSNIDVENTFRYVNRWKQIGKHLDCVSFVLFLVIWASVTMGFIIELSR